MEQNQNTSLFSLSIDQSTSSVLKSASQWGKIFAVCGFIVGILCVILGVIMQNTMNAATSGFDNSEFRAGAGIAGTTALVMYILIGLIYFLSSVFVLNFANKTSRALKTNDQNSLVAGIAGLRNFLALWAILLIIALLLILFGILTTGMMM